MAEVLILNRGLVGTPDWEDGDPIAVMPDGHVWGREELNPNKFRILKIPDVSPRDLDYLTDVLGTRPRRFRIDGSDRIINKETGLEDLRRQR